LSDFLFLFVLRLHTKEKTYGIVDACVH